MHPLDGVWLKVNRAQEHLDFLCQEIKNFWCLKPCTMIAEKDLNQSEHIFRLQVHREPPVAWGIVLGEFAFNLRSALDHLAWQLALLNTKPNEPNRKTQFPIFNTVRKYENGNRQYVDILPSAVAEIEKLQPYHRQKRPNVEHLWWLHEINNIDKHQVVIPCFLSSMVKFSNQSGRYRSGRLNDGDRIVIPRQTGDNVSVKLGVDIGFEFSQLPFGITIDRLDGIHKFIREEVIPQFTGFFP